MRKIKVAQIGTSEFSHGADVFESLKRQPDLFEIVGYALPENEREKFPDRVKGFAGYREMSVEEIMRNADIEAVLIETEEIYLTKYAQMAAQNGKHIHMEKPGGTGLQEFEKLISLVKAGGKTFHTGYMYRYNPTVQKLFDEIQQGKLGEIISVDAQMSCFHRPEEREWLAGLPGGMMFFLGCHLIDLVLRIQGLPKKIIPLNAKTGLNQIQTTDFGLAALQYEHGVSLVKTTDIEIGGFARRSLVVTGTKATVEIKPLEMYHENGNQITEGCCYRAPRDWGNRGDAFVSRPYNRYDGMLQAFAEYVAGGQNPFTPEYELELYKVLLQCCHLL